jgi:hypothetical protein
MSQSLTLTLAWLGVQSSALPVRFWGSGFFQLQAIGPSRIARLAAAARVLRSSGFIVTTHLGALVAYRPAAPIK